MRISNPINLAITFGVVSILVSCAGSGRSTGETSISSNPNTVRVTDASIDLTEYLTRFSGVIVRGSGPYAVIRVRGINSIDSGTPPLFIMDGVRMGRNYADVYTRVNMREVRTIRVLKGSAANIYGVAGGHGVIIIDTRASSGNAGF